MKTAPVPTLADIKAARERVHGLARETPVYSSETLGRRSGRPVFLKAENLQRTGSFKIRGAVNKLATMTAEERAAGVVTASAGNHGQAIALAAREAGVAATVFMPLDAPMAKMDATRSYGAEVLLSGEGFDEAQGAAHERAEAGATCIHAFRLSPLALPGSYQVRLTVDGKTLTRPIAIRKNPLITDVTLADLREQFDLAIQIRDKTSEANNAVIQIRSLKTQVADRLSKSQDAQLKAAGDKLVKDLSAVEEDIYQVKNQAGQDPLNFPIKTNNRLASLLSMVASMPK